MWDFLRDVIANLNRVKHGHRFSNNTKSFGHAIKIYGGRRMCDLFALNFAGPSYSSIKRKNKKGVKSVARKHVVLFDCISNIYKDAKCAHGIDGSVPIVLVED